MKRSIKGYFYDTDYWGTTSFKKDTREITWPATGREKPFVVLEEGQLFCYFPVQNDYWSARGERYFQNSGYVWARGVAQGSELSVQIINFDCHITYFPSHNEPILKQANEIKNLLRLAQAQQTEKMVPSTIVCEEIEEPQIIKELSAIQKDALKKVLIGVGSQYFTLDPLGKTKVLQAALTGHGMHLLSSDLREIATDIRHYLLPESIFFLSKAISLPCGTIYNYIISHFAQGDKDLLSLAQSNELEYDQYIMNGKVNFKCKHVASCNSLFIRYMFRDFCAQRTDSDMLSFNSVFYDNLTNLSLGELEQCLKWMTFYSKNPQALTATEIELSDAKNQKSDHYQIWADLLSIALIHKTLLGTPEGKIAYFFATAQPLLTKKINELKQEIISERYKKSINNVAENILRSIALQDAVDIFKRGADSYQCCSSLGTVLKNENFTTNDFFAQFSDEILFKIYKHIHRGWVIRELASDALVILCRRVFTLVLDDENVFNPLVLTLQNLNSTDQDKLIEDLGGWKVAHKAVETVNQCKALLDAIKDEQRIKKHLKQIFIETSHKIIFLPLALNHFRADELLPHIPPQNLKEFYETIKTDSKTEKSVLRTVKYQLKQTKYRDKFLEIYTTTDRLLEYIANFTQDLRKTHGIPHLVTIDDLNNLLKAIDNDKVPESSYQNKTHFNSDGETAMLIMYAIELLEHKNYVINLVMSSKKI